MSVDVGRYLSDCRALAVEEIQRFIPGDVELRRVLYDLVLDYPLREAKGLRPALCLAACRAVGGSEEAAVTTAAVIELYHNAFLVHDDVEDGSERRRNGATLHRQHGVPVAINVGDAMLALALEPLLDNLRVVGVGKSLRVLQVIARMARETAEGQAIELDWIRRHSWAVSDDDYRGMVVKKTGWYSFIAPVMLGAILGDARPAQIAALEAFAHELGIAFQIRDDVLNLEAHGDAYGKERGGDLWEGKRTLIVLHAMRSLDDARRLRAMEILEKRRPTTLEDELATLLGRLRASGDMSAAAATAIAARVGGESAAKSADEVAWLAGSIDELGSLAYASRIARAHAERARALLGDAALVPSVHRDLLYALVDFTIGRDV